MCREGGFSVSGEDVIEEINIFEGNENRLTFEQVANDTNSTKSSDHYETTTNA